MTPFLVNKTNSFEGSCEISDLLIINQQKREKYFYIDLVFRNKALVEYFC